MFHFKKNKKQKPRDNFELFWHILNPPSAFDGYAIIDDNKENLVNICKILTNDFVDIQKVNFEDRYHFVDSLVELKYITGDFQQEYGLTEIVDEINAIAKNLNYSIKLSAADVLQLDSGDKKQARELFERLTYHDLNVCAELLEQQGYELFQVFVDCGGYTMSILPKNRVEHLKQYTS